MSREEIQKLLGGYATDTLGEVERRALFEAALEDQEVFDALAKEQALRDVLQDPLARQQLLDALGPARTRARTQVWEWLRQPAALAAAGGVALLLIMAGLALRRTGMPAHRVVIMADLRRQSAPAPKKFEPPPSRQREKPRAILPAPPMLNERSDVAQAVLPAIAPALPQSAEVARELYSRPNAQAPAFATSPLPQTQMKMARAGVAAPMASNLGVRYSLLLKSADGEYAPTRLGTQFHPGDSVRLRLEPNDSGYLYLFERDATGGWRLASTQRVARGQPCLLPASGALHDEQPGRKDLLVVLSPREEPSLAGLQTAELDALAASASADLLKATVSSGESAYAVDTRPRAGQQRVAFEITLEFR
jgi:hypothetical protein